ncbi:hypothetical protein [Pedobacter nanyangensis]|uniref:hypothetical protein n=1 Tax=Pedobacter nanyangensis TaxID=1562389 RepID=UPI000DE4DF02|nr:hypothetical protein [Pedobacter nanyangensis]
MRIVFLLLFLFVNKVVLGQNLLAGNYTSTDGRYTVIVEHNGSTIKITEPNKENLYKSSGGAIYRHTEPKYAAYYIKVAANNKYYSGKNGGQEYLFTYSGGNTSPSEVLPSGADNCPLYDKYAAMIKKDPNNTQGWAFCAAAALAYCTYNVNERKEMLTPIIQALKSILEQPEKCPCEDVIPATVWKSVKID